MTKQEFIELTGEDPEDMFGSDWENEINEILNEDIRTDWVNENKPEDEEDLDK